jgi:hypothetical protein
VPTYKIGGHRMSAARVAPVTPHEEAVGRGLLHPVTGDSPILSIFDPSMTIDDLTAKSAPDRFRVRRSSQPIVLVDYRLLQPATVSCRPNSREATTATS